MRPVVASLLSVLLPSVMGCDEPLLCPGPLSPLAERPAFAVVYADYPTSTAIGLLARDGSLLHPSWLTSGTTTAGVRTTLSGDVVLPTVPSPNGDTLLVVDRFGTDVITELDFEGNVRGQLSTTRNSVASGDFRANPQDILQLPDGRRILSRLEPNLLPGAQLLDRGSDLVIAAANGLEPDGRVDLAFTETVLDGEKIYPRPERLLYLQNGDAAQILVGIGRLNIDFEITAAGVVATIDPVTLEGAMLPLGTLENCGQLVPTPDDPARAWVICRGVTFKPHPEDRIRTSGAALVELSSDGTLRLVSTWRSIDHPEQLPLYGPGVALPANQLVVVATGDIERGLDDQLVLLDGDTATTIASAPPASFGTPAYDAETALLLVADKSIGIRRFTKLGDRFLEGSPVPTPSCHGLPPREIRTLHKPAS